MIAIGPKLVFNPKKFKLKHLCVFKFIYITILKGKYLSMYRLFLIVIISALFAFSIEKGSIARFHRLLKLFEYPVYTASDKDVSAHFFYNTNSNKDIPREDDITAAGVNHEDFSREIKGDLGFTGTWLKSSALNQVSNKLTGTAESGYSENALIDVHPIFGIYDSSEEKNCVQTADIQQELVWERHFKTDKLKDFPFIGLHENANYSVELKKAEHTYRSNQEGYLEKAEKSKYSDMGVKADLAPVIGFGKTRPIRPVYQAFEVERHLRVCNVITGSLSDQTIINIAELCASIKAAQLRNDLYRKNFMKKLEQILEEDPGISDTSLDAYSLYKVYETFETDYPEFMAGFKGILKFEISGKYLHNSSRIEGPFIYDSFHESDASFHYQTTCGFLVAYPVIRRLFLSMMVSDLKTPELNGAFYFLATNRLFIVSGIDANWNRHYRNTRVEGYCDIRLYLEDKFWLNCLMKRSIYKSIFTEENVEVFHRAQNENISLGLNYDF
jgi:hypothetical protein